MTGAMLLKVVSLFLSIWAIRYYWKTQGPLDELAVRVRWVGVFSCLAVWFLMFEILRSLHPRREWVDAHPLQFVLMFGPPSFLCAAFLLPPVFLVE